VAATLDTSPCPVPWWLPDCQSQTLYGALLAPTHRLSFIRERINTPDGDFIEFDWSAPGLIAQPAKRPHESLSASEALPPNSGATRWLTQADHQQLGKLDDAPALVLLHGLEGSSRSRYAQSIAQYFRARGWIVVIAHFRGCSGVPNRMARAYHSGDTQEVQFILSYLKSKLSRARWHAVGVSLGGNALLKYLGEYALETQWLKAACGISVPLDLVAAGNYLSDNFFNRQVYTRYFLRTLKPKVFEKARRFPGVIDVLRVASATTLRDFDNAYTAPMHGFRDAFDYWQQSSCKPWLARISTPTLVLNAKNDPFIPVSSLPDISQAAAQVCLHQPEQGGHASFVCGAFPGQLTWLPQRIARFFDALA
jgi:hypothetical protein